MCCLDRKEREAAVGSPAHSKLQESRVEVCIRCQLLAGRVVRRTEADINWIAH